MGTPLKPRSFVENVNIVANATVLATGDLVEDTKIARDEAVAAKDRARLAEIKAEMAEFKAEEWAQKGYNSEVETGKYSSFHWSETARLAIGDPIINDALTSTLYAWSSQRIMTQLLTKSDIGHNHDADYEKKFIKNGAFNLNFGGTGVAQLISRSDHTHTGYELAIGTKNTAFNKNFGTGSGEVAEGSHNHDTTYMKTAAYVVGGKIGSAVIPWVQDLDNPLDTEVPRGPHTHKAEKLPYDNAGSTVISSTTVQGALSELDTKFGILELAKKTHLTAGISQVHEIPITGIDTPVVLNNPVALLASENASITNGSEIVVKYSTDPEKLIEGIVSVSITLTDAMVEDVALSIAIDGVI